MARLRVFALLLLTACRTPAPASASAEPPIPPIPVRLALAPGTVVRLTPITSTPHAGESPFLDGLWREALRQSDRFDVAGPA